MTALTVYGVLAPDKLRFLSELRVVPRKEMPFVPISGMNGVIFLRLLP